MIRCGQSLNYGKVRSLRFKRRLPGGPNHISKTVPSTVPPAHQFYCCGNNPAVYDTHTWFDNLAQRAVALINPATIRSAAMSVGRLVLALGTTGMIEASATYRPSAP